MDLTPPGLKHSEGPFRDTLRHAVTRQRSPTVPLTVRGPRAHHVAVLQVRPALEQLVHDVQVPFLGGRYERGPVVLEHKTHFPFQTQAALKTRTKQGTGEGTAHQHRVMPGAIYHGLWRGLMAQCGGGKGVSACLYHHSAEWLHSCLLSLFPRRLITPWLSKRRGDAQQNLS